MSLLFLILAIVAFLLAAFGAHLGSVALVPLGLASLGLALALGGSPYGAWPWGRPPG